MSFHKNIAKNMCLDAIAEEFITQGEKIPFKG